MRVKIQTNGSTGIENKLTPKDVSEADAIVVAHDVKVDTSVFGDLPYVDVPVKKAISSPSGVVDEALTKMVTGRAERKDKVIKETTTEPEEENLSVGKKIAREFYTHVMSGVSYMIPFVVVGGIFIA
ncbi:PTS fructose transporter subunit IIA, partial [Pediococcus acidilactici]|nr:PTS fructose transporter subunit IIA [Pediococcus acidilactici]